MEKDYYYFDDIKNSEGIHIQPNLIFTDLFSLIITSSNTLALKKRVDDIKNRYGYIDFRFHDYSTPLLLACKYNNNLDFFNYLIKNKANVNYSLKKWPENICGRSYNPDHLTQFTEGTTPLMSTLEANNNKNKYEIVRLLIDNGADLNSENINGSTPLMYAIFYTNLSIVKLIVERGCDINFVNKINYTPLSFAFYRDKENIFKYLIQYGADIDLFFEKINGLKGLLSLGVNSLDTKSHEMFYYARKYKSDRIKYICNLFPNIIGQPLKLYMENNP